MHHRRPYGVKAVLVALAFLLPYPVVALDAPTGRPIPGMRAEFFTLGWSRDGKVAYAVVDTPPFRNGLGFSFAIVDARTDELLVSYYDHSDQFSDLEDDAPYREVWQRNVRDIATSLEKYAIEPSNETYIEPFPLVRSDDRYDVAIGEWRVDPASQPYRNGVVGYTASIASRSRGEKVIARRGQIWATDISALGFVRSPFENRIAIIIAESGNAYGENRFTDFTIIGAHLDVGFE